MNRRQAIAGMVTGATAFLTEGKAESCQNGSKGPQENDVIPYLQYFHIIDFTTHLNPHYEIANQSVYEIRLQITNGQRMAVFISDSDMPHIVWVPLIENGLSSPKCRSLKEMMKFHEKDSFIVKYNNEWGVICFRKGESSAVS